MWQTELVLKGEGGGGCNSQYRSGFSETGVGRRVRQEGMSASELTYIYTYTLTFPIPISSAGDFIAAFRLLDMMRYVFIIALSYPGTQLSRASSDIVS